MQVCIISKFPPLEGGIAAKTYWLARAYADAGLQVHVISNGNTAEQEYRIEGCYPHVYEIPGVTLHEVEETFPWHIPDEKHSLAKLVDKFLEVHSQHQIDIIDTGYLIPYGIAGYLANRITGIPYVIRHGGSDIAKFVRQGHLSHLLRETIKNANAVITDEENQELFSSFNKHVEVIAPYVPNPNYFFPASSRVSGAPRLTFIGKINWHWGRKGLDLFAKSLNYFPSDWEPRIIGQGRGKKRFLEKFPNCNLPPIEYFVPPWKVPQIFRESDFVFCMAVDEPIPSFSNTLAEALSCGAKVVLLAPVPGQLRIKEKKNVLAVSDARPENFAQLLQQASEQHSVKIPVKISTDEYENYISANIRILRFAITSSDITS